jgi:hypothetical protein
MKNVYVLSIAFTMIIINISAWATHVIHCFDNGQWGFLIAGAVAFPVAIVHGIGIWFGFWV